MVHELYHIDPDLAGIRRIEKEDGTYSANCHGHRFFEQVAEMVHAYLDSKPSPEVFDFLRDDFKSLQFPKGSVVIDPWRYLAPQDGILVVPVGVGPAGIT